MYQVLKQIHPDTIISIEAVLTMEDYLHGVLYRLMHAANRVPPMQTSLAAEGAKVGPRHPCFLQGCIFGFSCTVWDAPLRR